jgi:hypothetical protein
MESKQQETQMKPTNGNGKAGKISLYDENWFPKISMLVSGLTDTDKTAIEAIVGKDPSETWDETAAKIGITARQLFNIRQKEEVQKACYFIAKEFFKGDVPDVLKVLAKKAKAGEAWAVRLFLEVAGEIKTRQIGDDSPPTERRDLSDLAEQTLKRLSELGLQKKIPDGLREDEGF